MLKKINKRRRRKIQRKRDPTQSCESGDEVRDIYIYIFKINKRKNKNKKKKNKKKNPSLIERSSGSGDEV